jgi:DNA-binding beta-propeller fold protein YncE
MNNLKIIFLAAVLIFSVSGCKAQSQTGSLQLIETIPLQNVSGRIDHLSFDNKNNFVFVAALANNTVEVADLTNKKVIRSINNLHEPQGVAFIPESNSLVIANGDNGECAIFNAATFQKVNSIPLNDDADNVRYDVINKKIYVGYGGGGIAVIDATSFKLLNKIKLSGHPESFQINRQEKKMYVNVPDEKQIVVIDLLQNKIIAQWKNTIANANFPMALDETNRRLFIGCRHPSKLLVLDAETGKTISSFDIDNDTDDVFYNASAKEIYVSCGSGFVDVFNQIDANHYTANGKLKTNAGARTSLFIPQLHQLIVAAPARMGSNAQLMIYKTN